MNRRIALNEILREKIFLKIPKMLEHVCNASTCGVEESSI